MDTNTTSSRPSAPPTLGIHVARRLLSITRQDWRSVGATHWRAASRDLDDLTLPSPKAMVAASLTADAGEIGA